MKNLTRPSLKQAIAAVVILATTSSAYVPTASASNGAEKGGGTDIKADQNNPWFLGDEPVEYCVVKYPWWDSMFQQYKINPYQEIKAAFAQWKEFMNKYHLQSYRSADGSEIRLNHKDSKLALNYVLKAQCDQPENQIEFGFGKASSNVNPRHKLAQASRLPYDHSTFRTGGTVYFNPMIFQELSNSSSSNSKANENIKQAQFRHILLHEIGHILGMPHDSVWVMDSQIYLRMFLGRSQEYFGQIEKPTWPFTLQGENNQAYDLFEGYATPFGLNGIFGLKENQDRGRISIPDLERVIDIKLSFSEMDREERNASSLKSMMHVKMQKILPDGQKVIVTKTYPGQFRLNFAYHDLAMIDLLPTLITTNFLSGDEDYKRDNKYPIFALSSFNSNSAIPYLDLMLKISEQLGHFEIEGKTVPVVLDIKRGLHLRLFIPGKNKWWSSQSVADTEGF